MNKKKIIIGSLTTGIIAGIGGAVGIGTYYLVTKNKESKSIESKNDYLYKHEEKWKINSSVIDNFDKYSDSYSQAKEKNKHYFDPERFFVGRSFGNLARKINYVSGYCNVHKKEHNFLKDDYKFYISFNLLSLKQRARTCFIHFTAYKYNVVNGEDKFWKYHHGYVTGPNFEPKEEFFISENEAKEITYDFLVSHIKNGTEPDIIKRLRKLKEKQNE